MLVYFFLVFVLIIILYVILLKIREDHINIIPKNLFTNYFRDNIYDKNLDEPSPDEVELKNLKSCQVPTLNTEQCYKSRNYECPIVNGSYLQCTNNYIPKPKQYNADCGNRTFDMVPEPWKISENCYYNKIGFNQEKEFDKVKYS